MSSIAVHRAFYANLIVRTGGSTDRRLIAAFKATERERYVGAGPWSILVHPEYISTVSDDPRLIYQDILVAIAPERKINNGQPSLHARCLAACAPKIGESVIHIGAGTGYYTEILALLVGDAGRVSAFEVESDLAARASANLKHRPNVTVLATSASEGALPHADVVYVNAGATHRLRIWLDALNAGGRLIFPMTTNRGFGLLLLITCRSENNYGVSIVSQAAFIPCAGARDDIASEALSNALQSGSMLAVKSLRRSGPADETACLIGKDFWFSTTALD